MVALILGWTVPGRAQVMPNMVPVPEGDRPPLIDGVFSEGEWVDAVVLSGTGSVRVLIKAYEKDVYLGVECLDLQLPVIDLFLRSERAETYHLHVSSYRADGVVPLVDPDLPYLETTLQFDWEANRVTWDRGKRDSLLAVGIHGQEMLKRVVHPLQGFEFRIDRNQFEGRLWSVLVELQGFAGDRPKIVFPQGGELESSDHWLLLGLR